LPLSRWQLLLSSQWRCCHCQCTGISAIVKLVLTPLLIVIALVTMLPSPLMHRHLCRHRDCNRCPHDDGIVAVVNAQASLLSSSWHHCPHNNGIATLDPQWRYFPCCDGVVAILKLALLPLFQWRLCHH
jgi:hypothetical protein